MQSYFYKKENLLSGLIFNKENITIKSEYETVLRFYGYDLDGASNMLTESKMNETAGNMTSVSEATDASATTPEGETNTERADDVTTLPPEASDSDSSTTSDVSEADDNTESTPSGDEENEDVTTAAPARKRRGRLGRGLKGKLRRQQSPASPLSTRRSRSYYVLLDEDYENEFHVEVTTVGPVGVHVTTMNPAPISSTHSAINSHRTSSQKELFDNVKSDSVEHIFYLNSHETVRVPFKIYDTVMKYAHVESLQASVLEIDLDTDYYNLILIVPDHHDGLAELTNKLRFHEASTLRRIRNSMEFCWVKTSVPKFSLKGNTILTNDLQNVSWKSTQIFRLSQ